MNDVLDQNGPMGMVYYFLIPLAIGIGFLMWRETWPSIKARRAAEKLQDAEDNRKREEENERTRQEMASVLAAGNEAERRHHYLSMKAELSASEAAQLAALTARLGYGMTKVVVHREACRNDGWWGD